MNNADRQTAERPCVSIVVPVYNVERYLPQCVNALLYQTLKNIEIILVDDGSPDNCPAMCDAYAAEDKRVKVIHQPNGGYGKACNAGFVAAQGEYIGIVESDDYAELTMMERLYSLAKAHNLDISRGHYYFYNSRKNTHKRADLSYVPQNVICAPKDHPYVFFQPPSVWAMIYRTDFLRSSNIRFLETPGASYQDASFTFKVYACAERFLLIEDAFIHYRIDNDNSSVNSKSKVFCICDEYDEITRFSKENNIYEKLKYAIARMKYCGWRWNYRRLDKKNGVQFLRVFSREMRGHISRGEIEKKFFSKKEIIRVYVIAYFYPLYHLKQYL